MTLPVRPLVPRPLVSRLLVLTERVAAGAAGRTLTETIDSAVQGGASAVILREKDLSRDQRREIGRELTEILHPVGGVLIVASDWQLAQELSADGVHLAASDTPPEGASLLVGRSCHNATELARAEVENASYVTLSPVFTTSSKPGHGPPLGIDGLAALIHARTPRVYALGGVARGRVGRCLNAGAYGVAVMGAVMSALDPASIVRDLFDEIDAAVALSQAPDGSQPMNSTGVER